MTVSETFPYVEKHRDDESDEHLRLKGLAIYWLLNRGFDHEDVVPERPLDDGRGITDIYAERRGHEVYIECEVGQIRFSKGGSMPAFRGDLVFVFSEEGIHRVESEMKTAEASQLSPSTDTMEREVLTLQYVSELPMLDLSAYK